MSVITEKKNHATPGKAMLASVTGYAMDGFDLLILGFMLPAISIELGLTSSAAGSLVTWTLIGAVLGGVIFGHLSDRFGRIRVLTITILMFSCSPACAPWRKGIGICWPIAPWRASGWAANSASAWR